MSSNDPRGRHKLNLVRLSFVDVVAVVLAGEANVVVFVFATKFVEKNVLLE